MAVVPAGNGWFDGRASNTPTSFSYFNGLRAGLYKRNIPK
jgi:hypothetical protein